MNRKDVEAALNNLSDFLGFDINNLNVYRLDIAATLLMDHPVYYYFDFLDSLPQYKRVPIDDETLWFKAKSRTIQFYDKINEIKKKKSPVLSQLMEKGYDINRNYLRFEVQIKKDVMEVEEFNLKHAVKVKDLYSKEFYAKMVKVWQGYFDKIDKRTQNNWFNLEGLKKPSEFRDYVAALGYTAVKKYITKLIKWKYKEGDIGKQDYYGTRKLFRRLEPKFGDDSEFLLELVNKIRGMAAYQMSI